MPKLKDEELIRYLREGNAEQRDQALKQLYFDQDLEHKAKSKVLRYGGSSDDAENFWIEAILKFDERVRDGLQLSTATVHTYITGIVKWAWYNRTNQQREFVDWDDAMSIKDEEAIDPELRVIDDEDAQLLQWCIEQIKAERCHQMLRDWALSHSPIEIADTFHLRNADAAKKETMRCRERLTEILVQHPTIRDRLKEYYLRQK